MSRLNLFLFFFVAMTVIGQAQTPPPTNGLTPAEIPTNGSEPASRGSGTKPTNPVNISSSDNHSGLCGYFYDLEEAPDSQRIAMNVNLYYRTLEEFINQGWNDAIFAKYFKSERPLYTDRFAISPRNSDEAPRAFCLKEKLQPTFWAIHYHGKVIAPEKGDYRFIGFGDKVLVVRIDGKNVLDSGIKNILDEANLRKYIYYPWSPTYANPQDRTDLTGLLKGGKVFHMEAATAVDMDVLIGDDGRTCAFYLLIERIGGGYAMVSDDLSQVPFFQVIDQDVPTQDAPTFSPKVEHPPYSIKAEPWLTVPK